MVTLVCQESVQVDEEGADLGQHRLENTLHQTMTEAKRSAMVSGFFFFTASPCMSIKHNSS